MKKHIIFILSILACAFTSCINWGNGGTEPSFQLSALQGLWQEDNTQHYVRFTTEQSDEAGYLYGREWDESEEMEEEYLQPYGNGWFKWKKDGDNVVEMHMTDHQIASIPYEYKMLRLSNNEMRYKETADADKQQFNKCSDW